MMSRILLTLGLIGCAISAAKADEPGQREKDDAAIRKAVASYVDAFNKADAKGLATMWSTNAVYTNPISGVQVVGRDAIEKQFAGIFEESKGIKLEATTQSIQFVSPSVAIETGSAKSIHPKGDVEESEYTAVYVKRDDAWLLDRISEEDVIQPLSNYEKLKDLEWLVGHWVDQDEVASVVTDCQWSRNENFLIRSFAVQVADRIDMSGIQIIGWDPSNKQIRSWVFDSDGGFGQGTWVKKGERWTVEQTGVLPDGRKSSAINMMTRIDDNTMTLKSINRTLDGELLPNIDEVQVTKE
ncbi:YybH family protein [Pirellulaceae bacterium SH467]